MQAKPLLFALFALVVCAGCASYGTISGVEAGGQKRFHVDGKEAVISVKTNSVAVMPSSRVFRVGDRLEFIVSVRNHSAAAFEIAPENVTVGVNSAAGDQSPKVFRYEDLVAEEQSRQKWLATGAALQAMGTAMGGSQSYQGTYDATTVTSKGAIAQTSGTFSGTYGTAGDPQAAQQIVDRTVANRNAAFGRLESLMLKRHTIFPGQAHTGTIVVQAPSPGESPAELWLAVEVGGEVHRFAFRLAPAAR
jgi:hypothetical protein